MSARCLRDIWECIFSWLIIDSGCKIQVGTIENEEASNPKAGGKAREQHRKSKDNDCQWWSNILTVLSHVFSTLDVGYGPTSKTKSEGIGNSQMSNARRANNSPGSGDIYSRTIIQLIRGCNQKENECKMVQMQVNANPAEYGLYIHHHLQTQDQSQHW